MVPLGPFKDGPIVSLLPTMRGSVVSSRYEALRIFGGWHSVTHLRSNYKTSVESGALCPLLCLWWVYHLDEAICYWFYHAWAKCCTFPFQLFHFDSRYRVTFKRFYFDAWHVLLLIFERSSFFAVFSVGSGVRWYSRNHFLCLQNFKDINTVDFKELEYRKR